MGDAFTLRECGLQDPKNRQNSIEIENDPSLQLDLHRQELIREWGRRATWNHKSGKRLV